MLFGFNDMILSDNLNMTGLSVIIPVYNRQNTIRSAVQSVLNDLAAYQNIEVIVVDDCSTDQTSSQLQDFPVSLITLDKNRGANFARNIGIESSRYSWVAFHDSDDIWISGKADCFFSHMAENDFIFSSVIQYNNGVTKLFPSLNYEKKEFPMKYFKGRILERNYISTQALFVRKDFLKKIGGFDDDMPRFQDWELAIRMFRNGKGYFISFPFSLAIIRADSISKNYKAGIEARRLIVKKHKKLYRKETLRYMAFLWTLFLRRIFSPIKS